jgi:hypothetical protein
MVWEVTRWRNLTQISYVDQDGLISRLNSRCESIGDALGIPVVLCTEGEPTNLPEPEDGVGLIVSSVVAKRMKGREDVFCPDTSDEGVVRDGRGSIIAVTRLQKFQ